MTGTHYTVIICFALIVAAACGLSRACSEHFPMLMGLCMGAVTGCFGAMQAERSWRGDPRRTDQRQDGNGQ